MFKDENYFKMNFDLSLKHLGKKEDKYNADMDMYHLKFKTYNSTIEGKFERSEIRHMIQILDNSIQ